MNKPTRWYLIAVGVIVALAVAVIVRSAPPEPFPDGTPEAAVQAYLIATIDSNLPAAEALLSDEGKKQCEGYFDLDSSLQRARIVETKIFDDTAVVEVSFARSSSGDAFASEYVETGRFDLTLGESGWLIDQLPWSLCWGR